MPGLHCGRGSPPAVRGLFPQAEGKKQGQSQTGGRTVQTLPADGAGENAEGLGEGIPLRDKGSSSQKNDQRKAIENDLIYGSPSSIAGSPSI